MSRYAERLAEERKHLSPDAVIERALARIDQDEQEKARILAENAAMRAIVAAVAQALQPLGPQPGSGVEILYVRTGTQEQARALLADTGE